MLKTSAFFLVLLATMLASIRPSSAGIEVAYDFVSHYPDAKVADAMNPAATPSTVGGVQRRSLIIHPTDKEATATYKVSLPQVSNGERLIFAYSAGIRDGIDLNDTKRPFDGVKFTLRIDGKEQFSALIKENKWLDRAVDLTASAGKQIEVVFATDKVGTTDYDWAAWGEPRILKLSNNLFGSTASVKTAKGIVVIDWSMGPNGVTIRPTGANKPNSDVHWDCPTGVGDRQTAVVPFDFTGIGATGAELQMTDNVHVEVYEFAPHLKVASFGPSNAVLIAGQPAELRCVVKNTGEGIMHASSGAKATLSGTFQGGAQTIGDLNPGQQKTFVWPIPKLAVGSAKASVAISGSGINTMSRSWEGDVVKLPASVPAKVTTAESTRLPDGTILLQNQKLRVMFLHGANGYSGWIAFIPQGTEWNPVASGSPLGKVTVAGANGSEPQTYILNPNDLKLIDGPGIYFTTEKQIGQANCHFEWIFTLPADASAVSITQSMTSTQPVDVLHFSGPMVYAGDQSFGKAKDEGLFPGLEYLLSESSSGRENAGAPYDLRTVPHPNKITIPFMAVRKGSTLVSLEWDPLQKWDGTADRPAAVFASPNFLDGEDNHKMGIFAPSVPQWTTENQEVAAKPYTLKPGKSITLKAELVVKADSTTVLDAVDGWVARHGIPAYAEPTIPDYEYLDLCDKAFLKTAWSDDAKAWKHTNTHSPSFDPMIAAYLLNRANYIPEPERSKLIRDLAVSAIEKAPDQVNLDVALLYGDVEGALNRMAAQVKQLIAAQKPDGSWPFTPDKAHEVFGKPGDSSSGWTAANAIPVLHYALATSDPAARDAGLKALKYLDTQSRPEGAQTWELQLHVPDILASGRLVDAYLSGYLLTDDQKYLDRAVYWARSGLPFVYLWNAADRPIMRYGTIPVFGVTWFTAQPWFGNIVQWCGLDYAYSIGRLADYDKTMPWMTIAQGILKCGIQQMQYIQKKYPEDEGMYPDAFSAITGEEAYHWDLNPRLVAKIAMLCFDGDAFPRTSGVTDKYGCRLAFTAPADVVKTTLAGEFLKADIVPAPGAPMYILMSGVSVASTTGLPSRNFGQYEKMGNFKEGLVFLGDKGPVVIKLSQTDPEINITSDLIGHIAHMQDLINQKETQSKPAPAKPAKP